MAKHFSGIMVPIMTPFDKKGVIDKNAYKKHLRFLLDAGIHGILVPSGTGEFANLTWEERALLIRLTAEIVKGKIPIIALVSDCSTKHVLQLCCLAKDSGADEVMLTPPYYSYVDQKALIKMFSFVADTVKLPLWLYHQPGETKLVLEPETVVKLSKHPNIVGIKIAAGEDFYYFCKIAHMLKNNKNFSLLMGEDFVTLPSYVMGGDGSVSSLANVIPYDFVNLWNDYKKADYERAKIRQKYIMDCFDTLITVNTGSYQSACKAILKERGYYTTNKVSSPFICISETEQKTVLTKAKKIGLLS